MSETLIIRNFGPIKDMSFEFKKINVFIGDQGTGKSTVAKILAAINSMASGDSLNLGGIGLSRKDDYGKKVHFISHVKIYKIEEYFANDTFIHYRNAHFEFFYKDGDCHIDLFILNDFSSLHEQINVTFIPADRTAINLFSKEILFSLNEIESDLPGYFIRFARLYNRLKKVKKSFSFFETLGIEYMHKDERDIIILNDGKEIDIIEASSAIQTIIPFFVILSHQAKVGIQDQNKKPDFNLNVIEEPELNSFPKLQNEIVKYIISCVRNSSSHFFRRTLITTHSPYILTSLNNLMFAYQVGQENNSEVEKIVEKKYWLNPDDVSAYMMLPDGTCESIIDKEGLIKAEKIDSVSTILNKEFNEIFDIELAIKK